MACCEYCRLDPYPRNPRRGKADHCTGRREQRLCEIAAPDVADPLVHGHRQQHSPERNREVKGRLHDAVHKQEGDMIHLFAGFPARCLASVVHASLHSRCVSLMSWFLPTSEAFIARNQTAAASQTTCAWFLISYFIPSKLGMLLTLASSIYNIRPGFPPQSKSHENIGLDSRPYGSPKGGWDYLRVVR